MGCGSSKGPPPAAGDPPVDAGPPTGESKAEQAHKRPGEEARRSPSSGARGGDADAAASGSAARRPRLEVALSMMMRGDMVLKFKRTRKPQPRFLFIECGDDDYSEPYVLRWAHDEGLKPSKATFPLADVVAMHSGQKTAVFRHFAKSHGRLANCCLSLVANDGTSLDVSFGSPVQRNAWAISLQHALAASAPSYFREPVYPVYDEASARGEGKDSEDGGEALDTPDHSVAGGRSVVDSEAAEGAESKVAPSPADEATRDAAHSSKLVESPALESDASVGASAAPDGEVRGGGGGAAGAAAAAAPTATARPPSPPPDPPRRPADEVSRLDPETSLKVIADTNGALDKLLREVTQSLGTTGQYTGAEVFMVVRAAARKQLLELGPGLGHATVPIATADRGDRIRT